jgi:hypothetical protein
MKPIIVTAVILIVSGFGSQANEPSQKLLALSKQDRHQALLELVRRSGEDCDAVVRSMLRHGAAGDPAFWNAGCRNRQSYWVIVSPNADHLPLVVSCKGNKDFNKMRAGMPRPTGPSKLQPIECWKKP